MMSRCARSVARRRRRDARAGPRARRRERRSFRRGAVVNARLRDASGRRDLLLVALDALRHDVAARALASGCTPNLAALLPHGWEARHSPATFTFAAHQAF